MNHTWLLNTYNMASVIKELNFQLYLFLINLNLNGHMWPVATVSGSPALDVNTGLATPQGTTGSRVRCSLTSCHSPCPCLSQHTRACLLSILQAPPLAWQPSIYKYSLWGDR